MVTTKQVWIGLIVLLLVLLLVIAVMHSWQQVLHVNYLHVLLADDPVHGC